MTRYLNHAKALRSAGRLSLSLYRHALTFALLSGLSMVPIGTRAAELIIEDGQVAYRDKSGVPHHLTGIRFFSDDLPSSVEQWIEDHTDAQTSIAMTKNRYGEPEINLLTTATNDVENWLREGWAAIDHSHPDMAIDVDAWYAIENEARAENAGGWNSATAIHEASTPGAIRTGFAIVTGQVREASIRRDVVYLNFGDSWKNDFTVRIRQPHMKKMLARLEDSGLNFEKIAGNSIRVRGYAFSANGPMIDIRNAAQLEVIP